MKSKVIEKLRKSDAEKYANMSCEEKLKITNTILKFNKKAEKYGLREKLAKIRAITE
jgi:hypothetical protein